MEDQAERDKGKNARKKPFKLTRQLIRLALNNGWTQSEIAEKCRTQQSTVSAWSKGVKYATETQLMPLLELFGHKLRRNTFRVYWALDSTTQAKTFFRVEGKVVFTEVVFDLKESHGKAIQKLPVLKLVVHHQGADRFRVVLQNRVVFNSPSQLAVSNTEDALWSSAVLDQLNSVELIDWIDGLAHDLSEKYKCFGLTLPFLLRQALLNHGFPVDGVVEYPAVW
ncbi:hypothetical protein AQS70_07090 [Pseudomonas endophytica]|uniref:HTH cro/C1-type domain-containing protein n=1 Tax=Pseudomonas endophytica TaxID=1563157 RepID=A0A0Q1CIF9_9PSED|nr:helix-turn-helix transcriptional regulator [Pseudomonas endophytica]KQB54541.1 hypothetical protein AQS70_07090 [Pseudomonas endophytica]